jgi:hypothetical protein
MLSGFIISKFEVNDRGFIQFLGNARNVADITFSVLASKDEYHRSPCYYLILGMHVRLLSAKIGSR